MKVRPFGAEAGHGGGSTVGKAEHDRTSTGGDARMPQTDQLSWDPDDTLVAWVQGELSRLLNDDPAFREEFVSLWPDDRFLPAWTQSGHAPECPCGVTFLREFLVPHNGPFWGLWSQGLDDTALKDHLRDPLSLLPPPAGQDDDPTAPFDGWFEAPHHEEPHHEEPSIEVPHHDEPPRAVQAAPPPVAASPQPKVTRRGLLRDVRALEIGLTPQKSGRRPLPQGAADLHSREGRGRHAHTAADHFEAPQVTGGEGPGLLGAEGTCILGPGLATSPNPISQPTNSMTKILNDGPLQTYGWVAGHIINSEWSTGDECTILSGLANSEHKSRFEGEVRKALHQLRMCYVALHDCGIDTRQLRFGISVRVRVSQQSWADVYRGFGDDAETQELARLIPLRITCSASLVGCPDPADVASVAGENRPAFSAYRRAHATLEATMTGVRQVVVQNQRAFDARSEVKAALSRKRGRQEAAADAMQSRKKRSEQARRMLARFDELADAKCPDRAPHKTKSQRQKAYFELRPVLAQHFEDEEELALLLKYFGY